MLALDIKQHLITLNDWIIDIPETGWAAPTTNTLQSHRKWTRSRVTTLADPHIPRTFNGDSEDMLVPIFLCSGSLLLFCDQQTTLLALCDFQVHYEDKARCWAVDRPLRRKEGCWGNFASVCPEFCTVALQAHLVSINVQASIAWERRETWRHMK